MNCDKQSTCPIYKQYEPQGADNIWIMMYCEGEHAADCERVVRIDAGEAVDDNLLPDGSSL